MVRSTSQQRRRRVVQAQRAGRALSAANRFHETILGAMFKMKKIDIPTLKRAYAGSV